ncbi:MAG: ribulose bisphosphate carboxylase small subunit [Gammaproteobacteria bacterium]|nr:ribulose bisphosphate carboxylase small subunit [Gammaproteobacteria bacterium]
MSNVEMVDYQSKQSLETFSFLPKFTTEEVHKQIAYIIAQGWTPAMEHVHPSNQRNIYWQMWKLPFFGETNLQNVVDELDACRRAYPDHHVRLTGYDSYAQSQGSCFVVYEGRT